MHLIWATDIHLDHSNPAQRADFATSLKQYEGAGLCLTGDLSEAPQLRADLEWLADQLQMPIYFILGNHDYYHGSIEEVRREMADLTAQSAWLNWMPAAGILPLSAESCILGHDCWGDGRNGDVYETWVKLKDFRLIAELEQAFETGGVEARVQLLHELGDQGAAHFRQVLPQALDNYPEVVLLMHPPPFREACRYGREMADDNWAPHFTCKAVGDVLLEILPQYPHSKVRVLAGHTHNSWFYQALPNLSVQVGQAEYGQPTLAALLALP